MLRYMTAGESHGKGLLALVDHFPAGLKIDTEAIDAELRRRQGGYGRGGRQKLEQDHVEVLTGIWQGITLGSPIALWVVNNDYKIEKMDDLRRPRPGHGDLSGSMKYGGSIRAILERASARETAARVAVGALAKQLLGAVGIRVLGYVKRIGPLELPPESEEYDALLALREKSEIYSGAPGLDPEVKKLIDEVRDAGDTVGGIVEIRAEGVPFGLGSHAQWDRKLDGLLAQSLMAVQAVKGVEIGLGFEVTRRTGSKVHDPIGYNPAKVNTPTLGFERASNNAGGLEAGMTNSQPLVLRVALKPISTLRNPLPSINLDTKQPEQASYERSDVCAVAAGSVVLENVAAFVIAAALVEKFGGDSVEEIVDRWTLFHRRRRGEPA